MSAEQEAAPVVPAAPREASLSRLLLWRVIGFSLLLSLGATWLIAQIHRDHEETQQQALIDAVVSLHRVALSRAVWALDDEAVQAQLAELAHFPVVLAAEVQGGGLSRSYARSGRGAFGNAQTLNLSLVEPGGEQVIGVWQLMLDQSALQAEVWTQTRRFIALVVPVLLLMSGLVFWMVRRQVSAPVAALSRHVDRLLEGDLAPEAPPPVTTPEHELHRLARGITTLQRALQAELAHRDTIARELAAQRDQLNAVLVHQRQQLDEVLSHMADGAGVLDGEGSIIVMNPAWQQMLDVPVGSERSGVRPVAAWLVSPSWSSVRALLAMQDRVVGRELSVQRSDGRTLPVEASLAVIERDAAGRPARVQVVLRDLSQRREAERTLITAREEALALARARNAFLANMSHEIRTPMNAVLGMTELALATPLSAQQRDYLLKSRQAATSLLALIDDVLDYSRMESGNLVLQQAPFTLDDVLDRVWAVVALPAQQKGLTLVYDSLLERPWTLEGDEARCAQVLINLCHNAVKFTDEGNVVCTVSVVGTEAEAGRHLRIEIQDSGIGIAPADHERVWQPFQQGDDSTTRRHGGMGMGLAICRQLVDRMGGLLTLSSEPAQGCLVTVTLPLHAATQTGPDGDGVALWPVPPPEARRVLVLHPHARAAAALQRQCRAVGHDAQVAADEDHALARLLAAEDAGTPFDLVIVNWLLPGDDAPTVARRLRQHGLRGRTRWAVACAPGSEAALLSAAPGVFDAHLPLPVSTSGLARALSTQFRAAGGREPTELTPAPAPVGVPVKPEVPRAAHDGPLSGVNVLLVEDNLLNQQVASELLQGAGAQVHLAEDGQAALDLLACTAVDVVLMDIQMPVMDGLEATRRIRQQPQWAGLPIIAVTAHTLARDREAALAAGMDEVLTKPLDRGRLVELLSAWRAGPKAPSVAFPSREPGPAAVVSRTADPAPSLPGIDRAAGERHCAGRPELHRRLMGLFLQGHRGAAGEIGALVQAPDWPAAARLLHVLKADAATIGATTLAEQATALEQALLSQDAPRVQTLLPVLGQALSEVLGGLEALNAQTAEAARDGTPA
ncbi:MAG: response regulator [Aquabacterium sp.]